MVPFDMQLQNEQMQRMFCLYWDQTDGKCCRFVDKQTLACEDVAPLNPLFQEG